MHWLIRQGWLVFMPACHSPDIDMIAVRGAEQIRVQVKTSGSSTPLGRWCVSVCTRGGNQSWNKIVKRFGPERCDYLFVLVADCRQWFLPADVIEATTSVVLGGPKYCEFEIERGHPFLVGKAS